MDRTLKIWNYHTGQCIRTLQGHTDGVVILDIDLPILASGSVDAAIKIWFSLYRMHYRELPTVPSLSNEGDATQTKSIGWSMI
jgi:WD40 repeat protein